MCTGIELLLGGLTAAGTVASTLMQPKAPAPPPLPAPVADTPIAPDATVKLGQEDGPTNNNGASGTGLITERRAQGRSLGGLGRSGLAL